MGEQMIGERPEEPLVSVGEEPSVDDIDYSLELGIAVVVALRVVTLSFQVGDLFRSGSEKEEILWSDFFANLDVRTVESPDG